MEFVSNYLNLFFNYKTLVVLKLTHLIAFSRYSLFESQASLPSGSKTSGDVLFSGKHSVSANKQHDLKDRERAPLGSHPLPPPDKKGKRKTEKTSPTIPIFCAVSWNIQWSILKLVLIKHARLYARQRRCVRQVAVSAALIGQIGPPCVYNHSDWAWRELLHLYGTLTGRAANLLSGCPQVWTRRLEMASGVGRCSRENKQIRATRVFAPWLCGYRSCYQGCEQDHRWIKGKQHL